MVGLDIRVKNQYDKYLYKILNGIKFSSYTWQINYEDFLCLENGAIRETFFGANIMNGDDFFKCISRDSYYMIFADIKAYPINKELTEIKTFKDFVESDCEFILLCTDTSYIEFYCKDKSLLDKVYNNCIGEEFEKVEYRHQKDVCERSLSAW